LSRRWDPRYPLVIGIVLMAVSCFEFAQVTSEWGFWELLIPQVMRGSGLMFCMVPANVLALGRLQPDILKDASGLYNLLRNLGGALGLAVLNTQLSERTAFHYQRLAENVSAGRAVAEGWLAGLAERYSALVPNDPELAALKTLSNFVRREASVLAFADCFLIIAVIYVLALLATPMLSKPANVDVIEEP
jgi:DHA2 family multidrug resistance protein